jgi:hypothetical protein
VATLIVASTWCENYGDASINVSQTFTNAVTILRNGTRVSEHHPVAGRFLFFAHLFRSHVYADPKVPILGLTQSLFEGSMYVFVFMWTPTLNEVRTTPHAPHALLQCSRLTIGIPRVCVQDPSAPEGQVLPYGVIFACFMVRPARRVLRVSLSPSLSTHRYVF